mmetsp:Transcript_30275/g.34512  ORF Transcript_30275/g.34512 Transcript_30275/m.34512 type:complete len:269 (-) Transcript_30275:288-1094(-)
MTDFEIVLSDENKSKSNTTAATDESVDTEVRANTSTTSTVKSVDTEGCNDGEDLKIIHVDSMHVDIDIPLSAESGELIPVIHEGVEKVFKIPAGARGQSIRLKMTKKESDNRGNVVDAIGSMLFPPDLDAETIKFENVPCTHGADDEHVDIEIPKSAEPGDILSVRHKGQMKKVKVPDGVEGGTLISVKMSQDFLESVFFPDTKSAPDIIKFKDVQYKQDGEDHIDIEIPEHAEFGDIMSVKLDDEMKRVKIPKGVEAGETISIKITQ